MLKLFKKLFSKKSSWKDDSRVWKETAHSFDFIKYKNYDYVYDTIICFKNNDKNYGHLVNHEDVELGKEFILQIAGFLNKGDIEFTENITPDTWSYRNNPALLKEYVNRFEQDFLVVYLEHIR